MTEEHKDILRRNHATICANMVVGSILPVLVAETIITPREKEAIEVLITNEDKADQLLRLLMKRQDGAFYGLINALQTNSMPHLARMLEEGEKPLRTVSFI